MEFPSCSLLFDCYLWVSPMFRQSHLHTNYSKSKYIQIFWWFCYTATICHDIYIYICMYIHMFYPCFVRNPNWHRSPAACCLICGTWQAFWREALVETDMCSWRGTKTSLNSLILATQKNLMSLKSSNFG